MQGIISPSRIEAFRNGQVATCPSDRPLPASNNVSRDILWQIQRSFQIHLREKSSYPENIPSSPADFFAIIPLKRRLSSHWKWNDRPFEARDLIICGIIKSSHWIISSIMPGISRHPRIEASRTDSAMSSAPLTISI